MSTHDLDEDHTAHPDWTPPTRPWCKGCCVPLLSCGCPAAEAELDRLRAQHLDGMGTE